MNRRIALIACLIAAVLFAGCFAALAETADAEASFSYLTGQQRSRGRNEIYAQAAQIESEEERAAFLAENGIDDTQWSEEAAALFSYIPGRERGAAWQSDGADTSAYGYVTGQQRGPSYQR